MDIVRFVEDMHHCMVPVSLEADNLHTLLDYSYNFGNLVATRLAAAPTLAAVGMVDRSAAVV